LGTVRHHRPGDVEELPPHGRKFEVSLIVLGLFAGAEMESAGMGLDPELHLGESEIKPPWSGGRDDLVLQFRRRQGAQPKKVGQQPFEPGIGQRAGSFGVLQDAQERSGPGRPRAPEPFERFLDPANGVPQTKRRVERLLDPLGTDHDSELDQGAGNVGAPNSLDLGHVGFVGVPPAMHDGVREVVVGVAR
jgi:hypothetical protein